MLKFVLIFCILAGVSHGAQLPNDLQRCKLDDQACYIKAGNSIMARGKKGYPEIGLPIFDPLFVNHIGINQGGTGAVVLQLDLKNASIFGFSGVKFTSIQGLGKNLDKAKIDIKYSHRLFQLIGPYKADGKVLVLPVTGDGIANITFQNLDSHVKLLTKKIVKDGKEYMQVDKIRFNFELKHASLHFTNLFNGNEQLGDTFNNFLSDNWNDILKEIKPAMCDSIASIFKSLINNVFSNIPYSAFFIE